AAGTAQGGESRVNTSTLGTQAWPSVGMDLSGNFVVAWHSDNHPNDANYGIYGQRFNSAGIAQQPTEFHVNTDTVNFQGNPSLAMDAGGDFVVAWQTAL